MEREQCLDRALAFLGGAALGAVTMYYFDPQLGRRRRSVCEDQFVKLWHDTRDAAEVAGRDLAHRAQGLAAEAKHLVTGGEAGDRDGHRGTSFDLLQEDLAPGTRLLLSAAGGGLLVWGLTRKAPEACVLGTVGLALSLPAVTGAGAARWFGLSGGRRGITVQKTLTIAGPVERVFPFFTRYANWPRFMSNLVEVRDYGNGRSHWVAKGPAGVPVSWDAVITRYEPNRLIAWRSEPGSTVRNSGTLHFEPAGDGNTRVTIHMTYDPPGGPLGHVAARLFGADPKSEMDEDLVRLQGLIEQGSTSAPGKGEVARQDVVESVRREERAPVM